MVYYFGTWNFMVLSNAIDSLFTYTTRACEETGRIQIICLEPELSALDKLVVLANLPYIYMKAKGHIVFIATLSSTRMYFTSITVVSKFFTPKNVFQWWLLSNGQFIFVEINFIPKYKIWVFLRQIHIYPSSLKLSLGLIFS